MATWKDTVVFGPNPQVTTGVQLDANGPKWIPQTGYDAAPGSVLNFTPSQGGPMRIDFTQLSGSWGGGFKAGWTFAGKYVFPIFMTLLAVFVAVNMVKRYAKLGGG